MRGGGWFEYCFFSFFFRELVVFWVSFWLSCLGLLVFDFVDLVCLVNLVCLVWFGCLEEWDLGDLGHLGHRVKQLVLLPSTQYLDPSHMPIRFSHVISYQTYSACNCTHYHTILNHLIRYFLSFLVLRPS